MDKIIYERGSISTMEPQKIVFEVTSDLTISNFKLNCRRMAQALGYSEKNITETFGTDKECGNPAQLKLNLLLG